MSLGLREVGGRKKQRTRYPRAKTGLKIVLLATTNLGCVNDVYTRPCSIQSGPKNALNMWWAIAHETWQKQEISLEALDILKPPEVKCLDNPIGHARTTSLWTVDRHKKSKELVILVLELARRMFYKLVDILVAWMV
jgi:hypothetical protein